MKKKKVTAMMLTAAMCAGCIPCNTFAASTYQEVEKAAVTAAIEKICSNYAGMVNKKEGNIQNSTVIQLSLSEAGSSVLNAVAPTDISWINAAALGIKTKASEDDSSQVLDLYVNGVKICTLNCYIDITEGAVYINIPEINETGYIKADLVNVYDQDEKTESDSMQLQMEYADILKSYFPGMEDTPEAEVLQSVLERYAGIILNHVDGQEDHEETVSAGGVEEAVTVLEAEITQEVCKDIIDGVMEEARDDKELESVVLAWNDMAGNTDYTYEDFLMDLEDVQAEIYGDYDVQTDQEFSTEETGEDDLSADGIAEDGCVEPVYEPAESYIMKTYVDTDGNIIGRQIAAKSEEEETNLFQYLKTKDGEKTGFLFAVDEADGGAVLEGSGTEKAGLLNGSYILSADGEEMLKAELVDQDLNALKEGSLKGTCFLSGVSEENDVMSGMLLTLTSNDTDNKNDLKAALSMGDSYLGAVFLTSEDKDNLTVPEKEDIREVSGLLWQTCPAEYNAFLSRCLTDFQREESLVRIIREASVDYTNVNAMIVRQALLAFKVISTKEDGFYFLNRDLEEYEYWKNMPVTNEHQVIYLQSMYLCVRQMLGWSHRKFYEAIDRIAFFPANRDLAARKVQYLLETVHYLVGKNCIDTAQDLIKKTKRALKEVAEGEEKTELELSLQREIVMG